MHIHTIVVGPIQTNCYIISDDDTNEAIIIDPGDEAENLLKTIDAHGLSPKMIICTHGHWDHVNAVPDLQNQLKIPFNIHEDDLEMLKAQASEFMDYMGFKKVKALPDKLIREGDSFSAGKILLRTIHTPGHTRGGICLYDSNEKVLFSGDTLFKRDHGRTDFPEGSQKDIIRSIKEKLFALPEDTVVLPGHGDETTIGEEKRNWGL